jgi:hypothetical protein
MGLDLSATEDPTRAPGPSLAEQLRALSESDVEAMLVAELDSITASRERLP